MTFTKKLDLLMSEKGLNRREFSVQSGVPYMTIVNFYEKGSDNVKLSTLKKIAAYFDVSLDYIADDLITERGNTPPRDVSFSSREVDLIFAYRLASSDDRTIVDAALHKYMSVECIKRDA